MTPLGNRQRGVLKALSENGDGSYPSTWVWGSYTLTVSVLDTLAKRGLVERTLSAPISPETGQPSYSYRINDAGKEALR